MSTETAGLLGPALRWSAAVGVVSVAGWIALFAASADGGLMSSNLHRLTTTSLAVLILGSLAVQLTARSIRGQRKLAALIDSPGRGYAAGYADGLAGRPAALPYRARTLVDLCPHCAPTTSQPRSDDRG